MINQESLGAIRLAFTMYKPLFASRMWATAHRWEFPPCTSTTCSSSTASASACSGARRPFGQEVVGVTATDLEEPGRFLGPGELVLSGLVWWAEGDAAKADRFVSALAEAGATALLAGEETHGRVPDALVAACRTHRVPIVAVPARTSFRAVTEAVYLRQWGDLSRRPTRLFALPENVRAELSRLVEDGAARPSCSTAPARTWAGCPATC